MGLALKSLAGLIQAGFDHRLLERSLDVLADADALAGSIPLLYVKITIETAIRPSLLLWWSVGGSRCFALKGSRWTACAASLRPLGTLPGRTFTGRSHNGRALAGSIPLLLFKMKLKDGRMTVFNFMVDCKGMY